MERIATRFNPLTSKWEPDPDNGLTPEEIDRGRRPFPRAPSPKNLKQLVKWRRDNMVTLRSRAEYEAAAMLMGFKWSKMSHTFYKRNPFEPYLEYRHPDTLEPLDDTQVALRRKNISNHGDAEYKGDCND